MSWIIREERQKDIPAIREVNASAFGRADEARLVDSLRTEGAVALSLVAEQDDRIIGHILFTRLRTHESLRLVGLAPMAALPSFQRQGIGSALIQEALAILREQKIDAIVVLGDPSYYTRFGFSVELGRKIACEYSGEYLMALELKTGALSDVPDSVPVSYPTSFSQLASGDHATEFSLQSPRLVLRNYRPDDWERVHLYAAVPEFSRYELWGPNTVEDSKKFVNERVTQAQEANRFSFDFAVCLKDRDLLIGGCGIRRLSQDSRVAFLGWAIHPEFQGKGFATEAAHQLLEFGFDRLGLALIYATCDMENVPSYKVMEKLSMLQVGRDLEPRELKGRLRKSYRYEITRDEWNSSRDESARRRRV